MLYIQSSAKAKRCEAFVQIGNYSNLKRALRLRNYNDSYDIRSEFLVGFIDDNLSPIVLSRSILHAHLLETFEAYHDYPFLQWSILLFTKEQMLLQFMTNLTIIRVFMGTLGGLSYNVYSRNHTRPTRKFVDKVLNVGDYDKITLRDKLKQKIITTQYLFANTLADPDNMCDVVKFIEDETIVEIKRELWDAARKAKNIGS